MRLYRTKLRPAYRSLRDASCGLPLHGVTIPYVIPLLEMLQREPSGQDCSDIWQQDSALVGGQPLALNIMLAQLDIVRVITDQTLLYKQTSIALVASLRPIRDLLELFDTRMHLRLLWGHRGCLVAASERYGKFEQVLRAMSLKYESATNSSDKESFL